MACPKSQKVRKITPKSAVIAEGRQKTNCRVASGAGRAGAPCRTCPRRRMHARVCVCACVRASFACAKIYTHTPTFVRACACARALRYVIRLSDDILARRTVAEEHAELEYGAKDPDEEAEEQRHDRLVHVPRQPVRHVVQPHGLQRLAQLELLLHHNLVHLDHEREHGACAGGDAVSERGRRGMRA